jgi:uncharacterized membrane-anchored protein
MAADLIVYFKSAIVGLLTLLASAIAVNIAALITLVWMSRRLEDESVYGWDFVSFVRTPLAWAIFLLAFAAGSYWEYRKLAVH